DHPRPGAGRPRMGGVAARLVLVVGDDDLIAGAERHRRKDDVDPAGGVGDEDGVLLFGADELAQAPPRLHQRRVVLLVEEPDRVRLHAAPPVVLVLEDADGCRPVGAVVEMGHIGIEQPHGQSVREKRMLPESTSIASTSTSITSPGSASMPAARARTGGSSIQISVALSSRARTTAKKRSPIRSPITHASVALRHCASTWPARPSVFSIVAAISSTASVTQSGTGRPEAAATQAARAKRSASLRSGAVTRSEEHTSELQSLEKVVGRLHLGMKNVV